MTDELGRGSYRVDVDKTKAEASVKALEGGIKRTGTAAEQAFGRQATGAVGKFDAALQKMTRSGGITGAVLGGVGIGAGLGVFSLVSRGIGMVTDAIGDSITAASDQAEALSKVTVVFGEQADAIKEWAKTASTSMGMSQTAALSAAGTIGNLFDALGLADEASAEMSQTIVQLAADLASFNNVPVADAIAALQSGLVGETEPMRRFGSNISAARVQAYALANGMAETASAVTDAMKVQARYAIILEDTKNAQGDFARTADGLANSQKTLDAKFADLSATMGRLLDGPAKLFVGFLDGLITSLLPKTDDALASTAAYLDAYTRKAYGAAEGQREFNEAVEEGPDPFVIYSRLLDDFLIQQGDLIAQLDMAAQSMGKTSSIAEMLSDVNRTLAYTSGLTAQQLFQLAQAVQEAGGDYDDLVVAIQGMIGQSVDLKAMAMRYVQDLDGIGQALQHLHVGVNTTFGGFPKTVAHAVVDMEAAIKSGKAGIIEQFRDLAWQSKHPFAQVRYEDWLEKRQRGALRKMRQAQKDNNPRLVEQYRQLAADIKAELMGLPGYAASVTAGILAALDPAIQMGFTWAGNTGGSGNSGGRGSGGASGGVGGRGNGRDRDRRPGEGPSTGRNASGTANWRGGWTWVGERGPELMRLPQGTAIKSNEESMRSVSGRIEVVVRDPDGGLARSGISTSGLASELGAVLSAARDTAGTRYTDPRRFGG